MGFLKKKLKEPEIEDAIKYENVMTEGSVGSRRF